MTDNEKKDLTWALEILDKDRGKPALGWASDYITYGLKFVLGNAEDHVLKVQFLYILNNISHWRHSEAKKVRDILKAFVKAH